MASRKYRVNQRGTLVDAIDSLTDTQATTVYKALAPSISSRRPEVQALLKQSDPNGLAASNGAVAKGLLKRWVVVDADPALVAQITAAIKSAQGGGPAATQSSPSNGKPATKGK